MASQSLKLLAIGCIANNHAAATGGGIHTPDLTAIGVDPHALRFHMAGMARRMPGLIGPDFAVTEPSTEQFLRKYLAEYAGFVARVLSVLPRTPA